MKRKAARTPPTLGGRESSAIAVPDGCFLCPFSIVIDTREQSPYTFLNLKTNVDLGSKKIIVPKVYRALQTGDYAIDGFPRVAVERKSKEDLFSSIVRRDNFEGRLQRFMDEFDYGVIMIESERSDILANPPKFTKFSVKSLNRTIFDWIRKYPRVHWEFWPGRSHAEAATFRILENYYRHNQPESL